VSGGPGPGCDFCEGTGLVCADAGRTPWRWHAGLPVEKQAAILHATPMPIPCPFCGAGYVEKWREGSHGDGTLPVGAE
jgi:hypothetical protein